ncbi:thioredoxin-disulfide reductase [Bifidobacterium gallicum]|uniref:Thioredoxin reductase n=1 Tax=Bifidobacterium gallicum DSM 20093 = LMG 11596 TaxID=561180 RepID=D1NWE5_9BIFI|nr:thioredoxin-disulfide reductase [Bifidobacterium gallicum]EFA22431.1 thioredoxin-disulfide reductase [Bifidobacterium gallicum DSM 20093 = LMG 11596]KFI60120.1 thioredoxin reductase [Bifidobacterium gallicum DSM 20093 = LMG 11596]
MAETRHVIIVGSGPAGYTAAIYLSRAGLKPLVIAGALTPGGQLINTSEVENFPGFPDGILGPDLMENMQRQAERFGAEIVFDDVIDVALDGTEKVVRVSGGDEFRARALIVATGASYRHLDVPGEEEYGGRGVSYCATCDGFFFRNKPIVVVGGGDSAFEEAHFLSRFGSSVTLVHRRSEFRASKIMVDRAIENPKIDMVLDSVVESVNGNENGTGVESVTVRNVKTNECTTLPANGVFVAVGHIPQTGFLGGQLRVDERGYILTDGASTRTSVQGVFAAGDCADPVYMQAISAAGMGCRAALDVQSYLEDAPLGQ